MTETSTIDSIYRPEQDFVSEAIDSKSPSNITVPIEMFRIFCETYNLLSNTNKDNLRGLINDISGVLNDASMKMDMALVSQAIAIREGLHEIRENTSNQP